MPTFRAAGSAYHSIASGGSTTSISLPRPTGTVAGDLIVAVVSTGDSGATTVTPSQSGWTLADKRESNKTGLAIFWRIATGSDPASWTFTTGSSVSFACAIASYSSTATTNPISVTGMSAEPASQSTTVTAPSITTPDPASTVVAIFVGNSNGASGNFLLGAVPAGVTERAATARDPYMAMMLRLGDYDQPTGSATGAKTTAAATTGWPLGAQLAIRPPNQPPNAPTLTTLVGGEVIDRANVNRASHSFSDPDPGDSQSAFDHRYRLVGAATWTTAYVASPNGYVDYPAGTFAAGDYERQVRTYDAQGVAGAWSPSGFFTAGDAPATPTITDPVQNETIAAAERDVTWSAPQQDAYQLQVLDGGVVEYDTATVVSTARTREAVPFPTNNTSRTVRVRVRAGGLWSAWYSVAVAVSFTPPPSPSFTLTATGTAIVVSVTNPAPGAGEPTVVANDVFVTEDGVEQRRAYIMPNNSWTYQLPKSGLDYAPLIRVEAVGDNGTRSSS